MPAAVVPALLFLLANLVLVVMIVCRRMWTSHRRRTHTKRVTALRPVAIELVDGEAPVEELPLHRRESEVLAELLAAYSRQLRGSSRDRIVAYFESSGLLDRLLDRLESRWQTRRATAAFTLGDIGSARAVPALVRHLGDRSRDVRASACRSLGRLGAPEAIEPIITAGVSRRVPGDVANLALLDIGPGAVGRLVDLSAHDEPAVRAAAVQLIGLIGAASDVDAIAPHLSDPAAAVRSATASALGRLGAREARDALLVALDDRVPSVRTAAARALGQIGGRQAIDALVPVARTDSFEPARAAAEALARIDPGLVQHMAATADAGPHVREAADRVAL